MERGKVYAFVGVVGSGKTFRMEKMINELGVMGMPVIKVDFSDGVRDTVTAFLTGSPQNIDISSKEYMRWKNADMFIPMPDSEGVFASGRQLLQNAAEFAKKLAGEDVWAKYAENKVVSQFREYAKSDTSSPDYMSIMFGSVRFPAEVEAVFRVGAKTGKDVQFIFCDYHSENYSPNIDHISEGLAQGCISAGFKDGDDITDFLYAKYCY